VGGSHLQDEDVAGGRLVGVEQAHQVGVVQGLQQAHLAQGLLPPQQPLVHVLGHHRAIAAPLLAPLGH